MSLNYEGHEVSSSMWLQHQNATLIWIAMFDGLYIDLAALKTSEKLLESSGWAGALVQAGVATPGKSDSML